MHRHMFAWLVALLPLQRLPFAELSLLKMCCHCKALTESCRVRMRIGAQPVLTEAVVQRQPNPSAALDGHAPMSMSSPLLASISVPGLLAESMVMTVTSS